MILIAVALATALSPTRVPYIPRIECKEDMTAIQEVFTERFAAKDIRANSTSRRPTVRCELVSDSRKEFYKLFVSAGGIHLIANQRSSLVRGLIKLADLSSTSNNGIEAPVGYWTERPLIAWRGVHLFVGPTALAFHKKLWTRYLLPLGFNRVVLQCERTEWTTIPTLRGGINMKRSDLAKLCDWYRSVGVEPIPLVESFGHMDWLLGNPTYASLALNKNSPYAIDPTNPKAKALLRTLWTEVVKVTKGKTVHFGLDEINLRGWPNDPQLVTRLWKTQVKFLGAVSRELKVNPMIWGDMAIGPGEAPDATNAPNAQIASERRSAIPHNFLIADWHYGATHPPSFFDTSLQTWQEAGFKVIAASWYRPANIANFAQAAIRNHAGILQTTWAGYESTEATMRKALPQFAAMAIAGKFAYSGESITSEEARNILERDYFRSSN